MVLAVTQNGTEVTLYDAITSAYSEFEYNTEYTIRKWQSNQCLKVDDEKKFLEPCDSDSMRWGFNDITNLNSTEFDSLQPKIWKFRQK